MISTLKVKMYIKDAVDWNKFFSVIRALGSSMNGQKDRFDKSDIIELAFSEFSSGQIEYINENGVDHILKNLFYCDERIGVEMKFLTSAFYGMRVTQRKSKATNYHSEQERIVNIQKLKDNGTISIKLMNSNGNNKHKTLPENYAKFLLVVDSYSASIVEVSKLIPYLIFTGDGITAKSVPRNLFTEIVSQKDFTIQDKQHKNYKEEKTKFQKKFLSHF